MSWILADWMRILLVTGVVAATTGTVWVKVQLAETRRACAVARGRATDLREGRARLQAAVDLALQPGRVRTRAERELAMVFPSPAEVRDLYVESVP